MLDGPRPELYANGATRLMHRSGRVVSGEANTLQRVRADRSLRGGSWSGASLSAERDDDAACFSQIYEQHVGRVQRHILSRVKNPAQAEDLTAQTFLKAWQAGAESRPPQGSRLVAWLLTIANHLVIDHYRRSGREIQEPTVIEKLVDDESPEDAALTGSLQSELTESLACLTPQQRFILARRVLDEMPYAEIARALAKSEGAVRIALHRALATLRVELVRRNFVL